MPALKEYFNYSKHERKGIFVLLSIILLIMVYHQLIPKLVNLQAHEYQEFKHEVQGFLAAQEKLHKPVVIEINSADTTALISLPGIGPYFAKRIIKYRDLLGGYYHKGQVLEVYGMDSNRYMQFRKFIRVDTNGISKININKVEFKALLRHPYFDYELVKDIFNHKTKVKVIKDPNDIKNLEAIDISTYKKIRPYLSTR